MPMHRHFVLNFASFINETTSYIIFWVKTVAHGGPRSEKIGRFFCFIKRSSEMPSFATEYQLVFQGRTSHHQHSPHLWSSRIFRKHPNYTDWRSPDWYTPADKGTSRSFANFGTPRSHIVFSVHSYSMSTSNIVWIYCSIYFSRNGIFTQASQWNRIFQLWCILLLDGIDLCIPKMFLILS